MTINEPLALWDAATPFPAPDALAPVPGMRSCVVHEPDADYTFLHDCAVAVHRGILHVAWYNCPLKEMVERSVIRSRRSTDGGRTWSEVTVISADAENRYLHVPAVLSGEEGRMRAWTCRMAAPDVPVDLLLSELAEPDQWCDVGIVAERFLPNTAPVALRGGGWLMAGRMARASGERALHPAVALAPVLDGAWQVVPLAPDGAPMPCPETTVIPMADRLVATIRPGDWVPGDPGRHALACCSTDGGHRWSPIVQTNLPMQPSKAFAGVLSTGQRYLIFNAPGRGGGGRELLVIALSPPGDDALSWIWTLQDGANASLGCTPEWSYPAAVESDGWLHIAYTSAKQRCVLSSLPVQALQGEMTT